MLCKTRDCLCVIDDDEMVSLTIEGLAEELGIQVHSAASLAQGREVVQSTSCRLILLDVFLPDGNALEHLEWFTGRPDNPEIVIITAGKDGEAAALAMQHGVWDYVVKPVHTAKLRLILSRALAYHRAKMERRQVVALRRSEIIGASPAMAQVLDQVAQAAAGEAAVLLQGETGTGKELVARAIHENSPRRDGPFIVVDCAALPKELAESILFGHTRGAFTGAHAPQTGLLSQANGGTLFLDEVGELPLDMQRTFLRALQEKRFRPVGATSEATSDFRLVGATNRDLDAMVAANQFRADLLYRLRSFAITLPPLARRGEDWIQLTKHFVGVFSKRYGCPGLRITDEYLGAMAGYAWPGNVRELIQAVERSVSATQGGDLLLPVHLPPALRAAAARGMVAAGTFREAPETPPTQSASPALPCMPSPSAAAVWTAEEPGLGFPSLPQYRDKHIAEAERAYLEMLLRRTGGDVAEMCRLAGLKKSRLYVLLGKYGLRA